MTSMSPNFVQEQLSKAYLRAVVFHAGYNLSEPTVDDHGIDGTITPYGPGRLPIDYQLKSTTAYIERGDSILYDLHVENYNSLTMDDNLPRVLVLFLMPEERSEWLSFSPEQLCVRKAAYWVSLMGREHLPNSSSVRVTLPLENEFSVEGIHAMFEQLHGDGGRA